jgi:O-antigen ligase
MFLTRFRPGFLLAALVIVCVVVMVAGSAGGSSRVGEEITRARAIVSTQDPNSRFRLVFWRKVADASLKSPLIGSGFDAYPPELIPPERLDEPLGGLAPHNSFVALLYRIGPVPFIVFVFLFGLILLRGLGGTVREPDPIRRTSLAALVVILIFMSVFAAFNVVLEVPYSAALFWTAVGLLAAGSFSQRAPAQ